MTSQFGPFEDMVLIGSGAGGTVYRAFDTRLRRLIAIKLLRGDDPEMAERFLQEARMQANVVHPNVCQVHEAGEIEGRRYITMQWIQGKPLDQAAAEMTLTEKVQALAQVADALEAAHHRGLVHRDIKPSNIMVEKVEDHWWPYVLDFGLAREQQSSRLTTTGTILGTPQYMAPEQARGEIHDIDHRSDIYSLGVTLYELLAGQAPFQSTNIVDLLIKVVHEEPADIRRIKPDVPEDLQTIALKCMEKDRSRRYDSAHSLAGDLRAWLAGEPITGRPVSWSHKMRRKARRNKPIVIALCSVAVLVILMGAVVMRLRWHAKQESLFAQTFADEISAMESSLHNALTAPLHDIRKEMASFGSRLKSLQKEVADGGPAAEGPGNEALGRGYLALGDYAAARRFLEKAWNEGYRQPSTAYALGVALGRLYQQELEQSEKLTSSELRQARKREAEKQCRDPALDYLKLARGHVESASYMEGLISFYEKRYRDALDKASEAAQHMSWPYPANTLAGAIYLSQATDQFAAGDLDGALANYGHAETSYRAAADFGRSEAEAYLGECSAVTGMIRVLRDRSQSLSDPISRALDACDKAIRIDPDRSEGYRLKALIYWLAADRDKDIRSTLRKALEMGGLALQRDPRDAMAQLRVATTYWRIGFYEMEHGINPRNSYAEAIAAADRVLLINPNDANAFNNKGVIYQAIGDYDSATGEDPRPAYQMAAGSYGKALQVDPAFAHAYSNRGGVYSDMAYYEAASWRDPSADFDRALADYHAALKLNPNHQGATGSLGSFYIKMAEVQWKVRSENPSAAIEKAIHQYEKLLQLNPGQIDALIGMARAHTELAEYQISRNIDPSSSLEKATTALKQALEWKADSPEALMASAEAALAAAWWARARGKPAGAFTAYGLQCIDKAIQLNSGFREYQFLRNLLKGSRQAMDSAGPILRFRYRLFLTL